MRSLLQRLVAGERLVSDGAMGTMLLQAGLKPGACPESVCLEDPATLETIARRYADAGADIVHTNTFGASPIKLSLHGLGDRAALINETAVLATRRGVGDRAYVSGSCGPCGQLLKPYGEAEPDAVYESFREQAKYLTGAGVDAICVETMTDLAEAVLAVRAIKDVAPALPVMATMTFDATPRGFYTVMGVDVPAAVTGLLDAGADVVGSNCGNGIERMVEIASAFRDSTDRPLIIQSNAGLPVMRGGGVCYDETPGFMAERVPVLLDLGVSIVGGCCGTTPDHIRAMRKVVDAGGLEPVSCQRIARQHQAGAGRQGEHVAAHRLELLVGHLDKFDPACQQRLAEGNGQQGRIDEREIVVDGAQDRHEVKDVGGAAPMRQRHHDQLIGAALQQASKLSYPLVVGAVSAADGERAAIEPDDIAALESTVAGDGAVNGHAHLAEGRREGGRLVAPLLFAHVAQDHALVADDRGVARVDGVEPGVFVFREVMNLGTFLAECGRESIVLLDRP